MNPHPFKNRDSVASDTHLDVLEMMKHSQTSLRDVPQVFI